MDRRILRPGWSGALSDEEVKYIQKKLMESTYLRQKWGITGYPTASKIRKVADG